MKKGVTWDMQINGGTIEGLFNDIVIGDVVHGYIIKSRTWI